MKKEVNKNFTKLTHRGISLIVLIVTIIVIIILAAAVILTISKNNPLKSAKEATFKNDVRNFQDELSMYVGNQVLMDYDGTREKITTSENPKVDEMQNYILSFTKNYEEKLGIEDDELVYFPDKVTVDEKKWLDDLGINPYGYKIEEADIGFFEWNGSKIIGIKRSKEEEFKKFVASNEGTLKIPSECTAIGDSVFRNCDFFENVIVNDEVTSIGVFTFSGCSNLKQVKLSNNIRTIKESCFEGCEKLSSVKMPDNITTIELYAFLSCESLKEIILPKSLKNIYYGAFAYCSNLENITIPEGVTSISDNVFYECTNLSSVAIPSTVTHIGKYVFHKCYNLQEINVSRDNENYSSEDGILFNKSKTKIIKYPATKKENFYEIPDTVTSIYDYAFDRCENLNEILLKEGIVTIGEYAFFCCSNLKNIAIPKSVTSIGSNAFWRCEGLSSIIIPINVSSMGRYIFANCSSLIIKCEAKEKPEDWDDKWNYSGGRVIWGYTGE